MLGGLLGYEQLPCAFWPAKAASRYTGPFTAPGAPPILVVGTTGDPATPYVWAKALARELDSGVLLTRVGDGHTAYGDSRAFAASSTATCSSSPRRTTAPSAGPSSNEKGPQTRA